MGHRSNFVLIENRIPTIYYSHWGALSVPQDLYEGPEATRNYLESMEEVEELLDDLWCEGGALIDWDEKNLLFFGGEMESVGLLAYYIPMLEKNWPDWKITWAQQGVIDFAHYLNLDPSRVQGVDWVEEPYQKGELQEDEKEMREWEMESTLPLEELHYPTIITSSNPEGEIIDCGFYSQLSRILFMGEDLARILPHHICHTLPPEEEVSNGAFIDWSSKELWVWWSYSLPNYYTLDRLPEFWPDWTIRRHNQGYSFHIELSNRDPSPYIYTPERAREIIADYLEGEIDFDPLEIFYNFLTHLHSDGEIAGEGKIFINPQALNFPRPGQGEEIESEKANFSFQTEEIESFRHLIQSMKSIHPQEEWRFKSLWKEWEVSSEEVPEILSCLVEDWPTSELAFQALKGLAGKLEPLVPHFIENFHHPNPHLRAGAARALSIMEVDSEEVLSMLCDGLEDPHPEVQIEAATTLAQFGARSASAIPTLARLIEVGEKEVKRAAVESIGLIGSQLEEGFDQVLPILQKALKNNGELGFLPLCSALNSLGNKILPHLASFLDLGRRGDERINSILTVVLSQLGEEALSPLIEVLETEEGPLRLIALRALGEIGSAGLPALPYLQRIREFSPHQEERDAANLAILKIERSVE